MHGAQGLPFVYAAPPSKFAKLTTSWSKPFSPLLIYCSAAPSTASWINRPENSTRARCYGFTVSPNGCIVDH